MWVINSTPRRFIPGEKILYPLHRAEGAAWPVWTGAENLDTTGIRSPDRPACSKSLYRQRYPGPHANVLQ